MLVDSNSTWLGLTKRGSPVDLRELDEMDRTRLAAPAPNPVLGGHFTWVYGLYSRHGRFYPPYDPIPDVNFNELMENFGV
jgi:hypothetical protein